MPELDPIRLVAAARRYRERVASSIAGSAGRNAMEAAPMPETRPVDRRMAYLKTRVADDRARLAIMEAESRGAPRDPSRTIASIGRERIIGSSDLVGTRFFELGIAVGRAVCKIEIGTGAGTGMLIGPRVVMTNHHVLESAPAGARAEALFDFQRNASGEVLAHSFRLDPDLFWFTDPDLDFTLIGVQQRSTSGRSIDSYPWLRLIAQLGKTEDGEPLNIIQHPRGGLKQFAFRNNPIIKIPDGKRDFLYYRTDTEPGSSGSPCFNDEWDLVALHHSGVPAMKGDQILKKDGTPWREGRDDPSQIKWIANEGARVSAIVDSLKAANLEASHAALRARMLDEDPPNPIELSRSGAAAVPAAPPFALPMMTMTSHAGAGAASITVPLTLTLSLECGVPLAIATTRSEGGAAARAATPVVTAAPTASRIPAEPAADALDGTFDEAVKIDPDWSVRRGYDEEFLGIQIPLPRLSTAMKKLTAEVPQEFRRGSDPFVLDYHHYSVVMRKERRFAWYSAANVDGDRRFKIKREKDKWFIDPRIDDPKSYRIQCGEELYATDKTDRGHLTRYLDVAWGDTIEDAIRATNDTFHFTNCCLQLSGFNQGKDRWQGIEQYLLENKARKEKRRISVMTGPIFSASDPVYRNPRMNYSIRIPVEFWKVCALVRSDGTLAATGFVLGQQDVAELPGFEEAFDVVATQVTLKDLEGRTGLRFGTLTEHDHFASGGAPGSLEVHRNGGPGRLVKPLRAMEDIVI